MKEKDAKRCYKTRLAGRSPKGTGVASKNFNSQPRKGTDSNFSQKYCLAKIVFCIYFTYFY